MTSIEQAWLDCLIADISYVDNLNPGLKGRDLADRLERRMTAPLAKVIGDRFEVLSREDVASSDFQGYVFLDRVTGDLYLANRGTAPGKSFQDVVDDLDLALNSGIARTQTASMINWWLAISAPRGQLVPQIKATNTLGTVFVAAAPVVATGDIHGDLLVAGGKVRVAGHSLGGHLTTVFSSLFPDSVSHSSTFNGAGLFSVTTQAWAAQYLGSLLREPLSQAANLIGVTISYPTPESQDNFYGYNGLNLTTNAGTFTQFGTRIPVYNEDSRVLGALPVPNHFLYKLTDSLRLFTAIEKLVPSIQLETLNKIAEAASARIPDSLEKLLDGLRRVVIGGAISDTPAVDDGGTSPQRTAYHQNLDALITHPTFLGLVGRLSIELASRNFETLAAQPGSSGLPYRHALKYLTPFALVGRDANASEQLYSQFTQELALFDPASGVGFTPDKSHPNGATISRPNGASRSGGFSGFGRGDF